MELRQIKYFLTAAKYLNFTVAASELNVSQSTLSRQITAMEQELNLLLFFRDNRNVRLTECGKYLQAELGRVYGDCHSIFQNAQRIFQGFSGSLTFGILEELTLEGRMQEVLHRHQIEHPNHTIDMKRGSFKELTEGLIDASFDFILTFFFDITNLLPVKYKVVERPKDGILISAKNPLSKKIEFYPPLFKNETFIILSQEDSAYASKSAIEFCQSYGFYPKIKFAPNLDTAMLWVEAGMGLAFTYSKSVASHNPSMKFLPFADGVSLAGSLLVLAWNAHSANPAVEPFLACFEAVDGEREGFAI